MGQGKGQKISEEVHGKENKKSDKHPGKEELVKKEAIENKFDSNVGYLAAFETFLMGKDEKTPTRDKMARLAKPCDVSLKKLKHSPIKNHIAEEKTDSSKKDSDSTFKILNSTMHPKKVLKTLKDRELEKARLKKKDEENKVKKNDKTPEKIKED